MVCVQFVGQSHTSDWIVVNDTREDTVAHFSPQGHRFNRNSPYRHWVQAVDRKGGSCGRRFALYLIFPPQGRKWPWGPWRLNPGKISRMMISWKVLVTIRYLPPPISRFLPPLTPFSGDLQPLRIISVSKTVSPCAGAVLGTLVDRVVEHRPRCTHRVRTHRAL